MSYQRCVRLGTKGNTYTIKNKKTRKCTCLEKFWVVLCSGIPSHKYVKAEILFTSFVGPVRPNKLLYNDFRLV